MRGWRHSIEVVLVLVAKDLKVRYRSTVLGYAWSVMHPLLFALVLYAVFKRFLRIQVENYTLFLIAGLFPWQWIQNSALASAFYFLGNSNLIKKVRFPRQLLVASGVLNDLIHFVLTIPVIVAFLLWHDKVPAVAWFYQVPLMVLVTFLSTYGLALFTATLNLFFRDLERLVSLLFLLWFYITPILYPTDMIPERYQWINYANPLAPLIICWRSTLLDGALAAAPFAAGLAWGVVFCLAGTAVYRRLQWKFAELV